MRKRDPFDPNSYVPCCAADMEPKPGSENRISPSGWFAVMEFKCRHCDEKYMQPIALEPTDRDRQIFGQGKADGKREGYLEGLKKALDLVKNTSDRNRVVFSPVQTSEMFSKGWRECGDESSESIEVEMNAANRS